MQIIEIRIITTRNNSMCQKFNFNLMTALIPPLEYTCFSADGNNWTEKAIWSMKWQFVVKHTVRQIEIAALLDSLVAKTPSVKMLCSQKYCLSSYFYKNVTCLKCWSVEDRSSFSCLIVCRWNTINCCFIRDSRNALLFTKWRF